jgi:hypothetical protein
VHTVQARGFRELILRESSFLSQSRNPSTDHDLNVRLQPISVGRMLLKSTLLKSNRAHGVADSLQP